MNHHSVTKGAAETLYCGATRVNHPGLFPGGPCVKVVWVDCLVIGCSSEEEYKAFKEWVGLKLAVGEEGVRNVQY